jgi:dihydrofolate reductase
MKTDQEIIIIAAMSENRVIGLNNALPWSIREDMLHFRELTTGFPCIMGRKTWESLPKRPLPNRVNLVLSASLEDNIPGARVFPSLAEAIAACAAYPKVFICGGASVYRDAVQFAGKIELTVIRREYKGDAFFPEIDPRLWEKTRVLDHDFFSFISYSKIKPTADEGGL